MPHTRRGIIGLLAGLALPVPAWAAGGSLPWEKPLQKVLDSMSGPVAQALGVIAIIVFGLTLAWSEGGGLRTALGILFGLAIAYSASSFFLSFFGFAGGAVF